MEPAAHGKPVLVGPYMFNFREIFELLSRCGVCIMNADEKEFEDTLLSLLENPSKRKEIEEAALAVVRENQGATERNIDAFKELAEKCNIDLTEDRHES